MKIRYAAKISLNSARSIAPSHIHVSLNALVAFDQRVACFHLIPEARLIRGLTRYHRTYFWTLFAYANAVPAAGDPVSEIVKLNRARASALMKSATLRSPHFPSADARGRDLKLLKQYISSFNDHC